MRHFCQEVPGRGKSQQLSLRPMRGLGYQPNGWLTATPLLYMVLPYIVRTASSKRLRALEVWRGTRLGGLMTGHVVDVGLTWVARPLSIRDTYPTEFEWWV